jgi:adenosylhomocysteine nucleosidase
MIGIIGAMGVEIKRLSAAIEGKKTVTISGIEYHSGRLCGKEVVTAACGIGKVAAAVCAQTMILKFKPELIINTGVAGSLSPELGVGDIAIAEFSVQHDMDTSPIGDPVGFISGINLVKIPSSERVTRLLEQSIRMLGGVKSLKGTVASGDQFINCFDRKKFIVETFGAVACDMECASIAQVCYINGMDFGAVRAISDSADDDSHVDYARFLETAAENASEAVKHFLELH